MTRNNLTRTARSAALLLLLAPAGLSQIGVWILPNLLPDARTRGAIAYDQARGVTVIFGGWDGSSRYNDDTWEWDGTSWNLADQGGGPSMREGCAMAYDPTRGVVVLFGGTYSPPGGPFQNFADTWEWDGTSWTQRPVNGTWPSARDGHAMAYDSKRCRVLMFGGVSGTTPQRDLWEWNGTSWTQRAMTVPWPSAREDHAMAYDQARRKLVVYGGWNGATTSYTDTWEWDSSGAYWTNRGNSGFGAQGRFRTATYDAGRATVVRYDGPTRATLAWNGAAGTWTALPLQGVPNATRGASLAYDIQNGALTLFGGQGQVYGRTVLTPTSELLLNNSDTNRWVLATPQHSPTVYQGHAMASSPSGSGVVLFGGDDQLQSTQGTTPRVVNQTSLFDGGSWTLLAPQGAPLARYDASMVHDTTRNVLVMHGGTQSAYGQPTLTDTWELSFTGGTWQWTQTNPGTGIVPTMTNGAATAYDAARQEVVWFGGSQIGGLPLYPTRTFLYDPTTANWQQVNPATSPPGRRLHGMAFDPISGLVILFGGLDQTQWRNDTWAWDGGNWTQLSPTNSPPAVQRPNLVYDPLRQGVVMVAQGETWELVRDTVAGQWTWKPRVVGAPVLNFRSSSKGLAYDPGTLAPVYFGYGRAHSFVPGTVPTTWSYEAGCGSVLGTPILTSTNLPWLGKDWVLSLKGLPTGLPAGQIASLSLGASAAIPPISLAGIGMPGCFQHINGIFGTYPFAILGGSDTAVVRIVDNPAMVGVPLYGQAVILSPGTNPAQIIVSDAHAGIVGD